jgi:nucleoside-diphosphate-sugar epimerase
LIKYLEALPITLVKVDMSNEEDFEHLPSNVYAIIHVAAELGNSQHSIKSLLKTNVLGSYNVQRYAIKALAKKIVYMSSISIHGKIDSCEVDYLTQICDPNLYGVSKYLGERIFFQSSESIPAIAIRLPGVLGTNYSSAWIPRVSRLLLENKDITAHSFQNNFNNAIHVNDLSEFILKIIKEHEWDGFHAFPVGASGNMRIIDVLSFLRENLSSKSIIYEVKNRESTFTINSEYAISKFLYYPKEIKTILTRYSNELLIRKE